MQGVDTDRTKFDARDYSVTCANCGNTFEATRSDASYCTPKCRKYVQRAPIRKQHAIEALRASGYHAEQTARKYKKSEEVYKEMLKLQSAINFALACFERGSDEMLGSGS